MLLIFPEFASQLFEKYLRVLNIGLSLSLLKNVISVSKNLFH